jgi:hypothetical protein
LKNDIYERNFFLQHGQPHALRVVLHVKVNAAFFSTDWSVQFADIGSAETLGLCYKGLSSYLARQYRKGGLLLVLAQGHVTVKCQHNYSELHFSSSFQSGVAMSSA